jgi:uncharacterized protein (DUF885 family)
MEEEQREYIHKMVSHVNKIKNKNIYKKYKKCFHLTHLKGIHLDFYDYPFHYTLDKFEEEVYSSILKMQKCIAKNILLPIKTLEIIIQQCNLIIANTEYWERLGYNQEQIKIITRTYNHLIISINDILNGEKYKKAYDIIGLGRTEEGLRMYKFCLKLYTGSKYDLDELQKLAIDNMNKIIKDIELIGQDSYDVIKSKYLNKPSFNSPHDLMENAKKNVIKLVQLSKELFNETVYIPEQNKIKIKPMPELTAMWSSNAKTFDDSLYINLIHWDRIRPDMLFSLCSHETVPGLMLREMNIKKTLKELKIKKDVYNNLLKSLSLVNEGYACFIEDSLINPYDPLPHLFIKLKMFVRLYIDIEINTKPTSLKSIFDFMRKYTLCDDKEITTEISRCLSEPAYLCNYALGYVLLNQLKNNSMLSTRDFNSIIAKMPLNIELLTNYITNKN